MNIKELSREKLESLYRGMYEANTKLHKQLIDKDNELQEVKKHSKHVFAGKMAQDAVMNLTIKNFNKQKEALLKENQLLKEQIQRLKDGSVG